MGNRAWGLGHYQGLEEGREEGREEGLGEGRIQGAVGVLVLGGVVAAGSWGIDRFKKSRAADELDRRVRERLAQVRKRLGSTDDNASNDGGTAPTPPLN